MPALWPDGQGNCPERPLRTASLQSVDSDAVASAPTRLSPARTDPFWITLLLLAAALVAWLVTFARMDGMDAGPGTDLGSLGWYVGVWVTMMAAMMLPSATPMVRLYAHISREQNANGAANVVRVAVFVGSYLGVWTAFGLAAFGLDRLVASVESGTLSWDRAGPYVAGGAVVAAGLYELTPLKHVCLRHCRTPLHFLLGGWREGVRGAARTGAAHGIYCSGCCVGLMLILFAVGVMSLFWMVLIAAVIFSEKLLPGGERLSRFAGAAFILLGVWIAVAPESVPWLTDPGSAGSMMARVG